MVKIPVQHPPAAEHCRPFARSMCALVHQLLPSPPNYMHKPNVQKEDIPLKNLRGVLILLIVAFHAFSAYIVNQPARPPDFEQPPFEWLAFPIIDDRRWIGFDLFCAAQFLYLMQLMFFLSGLFVWSSLLRKGCLTFLGHRLVRLGLPFLLGVYLLIPVAFYPVYRLTALDPSFAAFWSHWTALPITPTGPMWFLWYLITLDAVATAIYRLAAGGRSLLPPWSVKLMLHPGKLFIFVVCVTAAAYLPLSAIYSPWKWVGLGPLEIQPAFAPQYAFYFLLGLAVGIYGRERGLLKVNGTLVRRWPIWSVGSFAAFLLWLVPTALIAKAPVAPVALLRVMSDFGVVIFAAAACFALTAVFVRFAGGRWPIVDTISENAYGIYFFHYGLVLWLQYALLDLGLPAVVKGGAVLIVTLLLSWAAAAVTNRVLAAARPLGERLTHLLLAKTEVSR
jgi:hypothetical protein